MILYAENQIKVLYNQLVQAEKLIIYNVHVSIFNMSIENN